MKHTARTTIALLTLTLATAVGARIRNVPRNFPTIQMAVNTSLDGDTVRVAPGRYHENVNMSGYQILLVSWILDDDDAAYIDSTIIDGDSLDCCLALDSTNLEDTIIRGFTLTRGIQNFGGGIDVQNDGAPRLYDLRVTGNWARQIGGGIYCTTNSTPRIERVEIFGNYALDGAGIGSAHAAHPEIVNCLIHHNLAASHGGGVFAGHGAGEGTLSRTLIYNNLAADGGGVYLDFTTNVYLFNVTLAGNEAEQGSGVMLNGSGNLPSEITLVNTILWDEGVADIFMEYRGNNSGNVLNIAYCDLRDGQDSIVVGDSGVVNWGAGNLADDPLFADPDNADFSLDAQSPCIDRGDPDSPPDPDGSRADIGALPFFGRGYLSGLVLNFEDGSPLAGASVWTSFHDTAATDTAGFWKFPLARIGQFNLTAAAAGYADSTLPGLLLEEGDTLDYIFSLGRPVFSLTSDSLIALLPDTTAESQNIPLTLGNPGSGRVAWSARPHNRGEPGTAPWEVRRSFEFGNSDAGWLQGALFTDDNFLYLFGNRDYTWGCIMNREGEPLDSFGLDLDLRLTLDVDWDGELFWVAAGNLYGYDLTGALNENLEFAGKVAGIACDRKTGDRFLLLDKGDIAAYDREFNLLNQWAAGMSSPTGIAYRDDDPDGYPLYTYRSIDDTVSTTIRIDKLNLETGEVMNIWSYTCPPNEWLRAGSAQLTDRYDPFGGWVMVTASLKDPEASYLEVRQVQETVWWISLDTSAGVIEPGAQDEITLTISRVSPEGKTLETGVYEGELIFTHNTADGETILPVTLTVEESSGTSDFGLRIAEFWLGDAAPNPFNSVAVARYKLRGTSAITLKLYDLNGRMVQTLVDERQSAGEHRAVINAEALASGVYILKLAAGNQMAARKIVCIK